MLWRNNHHIENSNIRFQMETFNIRYPLLEFNPRKTVRWFFSLHTFIFAINLLHVPRTIFRLKKMEIEIEIKIKYKCQ